MKKITLLFILFLSINSLHGMKRNLESEQSFPLAELPTEAKAVVIQAICTYDNLDDIINTIDATKCVNREFNSIVKHVYSKYNNLKEFTALVHFLSDKFPTITTEDIAKKLKTPLKLPIAQKYVALGKALLLLSMNKSTIALNATKKIITEEGADANFTTAFMLEKATGGYHVHTPFLFAIQMDNVALIELLNTFEIKAQTLDATWETLKKVTEARKKRGIQPF